MMSYLWILLLGSLLAGGAGAQEEDAVIPEDSAPDADPAVEPEADEGIEPTVEEVPTTDTDQDAAADPEADAPEAPEVGAPEVDAAEADAADAEADAADAEADAAEADVPESATSANEDAEAGIDGTEEEAAATTESLPAADPVPDDPESDVDDGPAAATDAPPAQEEDHEVEIVSVENQNPDVEETTDEEPTGAGDDGTTTDSADVGAEKDTNDAAMDADEEDDATETPEDAVVEEERVTDVLIPVKAGAPEVGAPPPEVNSDDGFDLADALDGGAEKPSRSGNSRSSGAGAHVAEAARDAEVTPEPKEGGSSAVAAILSVIGVALVGAVAGYFTYQKKKLCFKNTQEADPEAARKADAVEAQSDPQVLSNLLNSS